MLLPGMLLTGAVPAVACEIYGALSALPYTRRYRLYSELRVCLHLHLLCLVGVLVRIRQTLQLGLVWLGPIAMSSFHLKLHKPGRCAGDSM